MTTRLITRSVAFAVLIITVSGCQTPPPQVNVEEEMNTIAELTDRWAEAEAQRDLEGSLSLVADDATWLPPDAEAVHGIEAIGTLYQNFFDQVPYTSLAVEPSRIAVSAGGDVAYSWSNFTLGFDGPDGPSSLTLKFLATWEKRDGEWKVTANMFNSNAPAAAE